MYLLSFGDARVSRRVFVLVVALILCAATPALLTTTPTKGYPASVHSDGNQDVGAEKKTWTMAYMWVYWNPMPFVEEIISKLLLLQPLQLYRYIKNHSPVGISSWGTVQKRMIWNVTAYEWESGQVTIPAKVKVDILWGPKPEWPELIANLPYGVKISWHPEGDERVRGGGAWRYLYGSNEPAKTLRGGNWITVRITDKNASRENYSFYLILHAGWRDIPWVTIRETGILHLTINRINESENKRSGCNNSTELTTYHPMWESVVAYRVIAPQRHDNAQTKYR